MIKVEGIKFDLDIWPHYSDIKAHNLTPDDGGAIGEIVISDESRGRTVRMYFGDKHDIDILISKLEYMRDRS